MVEESLRTSSSDCQKLVLNEIAKALCIAQSEILTAHKDSKNPYFNSKYADLKSVWDAIRLPLTKNGLSITQLPSTNGKEVTVETILMHVSGQYIRSTLTIIAKDISAHAIGSAITYARRYALMAMVGVSPEDDDGNAAVAPATKPTKRNISAEIEAFKALDMSKEDVEAELKIKIEDASREQVQELYKQKLNRRRNA